jgi:hypothetical protein
MRAGRDEGEHYKYGGVGEGVEGGGVAKLGEQTTTVPDWLCAVASG